MPQREISNYTNRYFSFIGISGRRGHAAIAIAQRSSSNGSHHKVNRFWNRYVRASCDRKHQTPSTKHQRNSKLQPPKTWEVIGWSLKIGASLGFGGWDLELTTTHLHIMMRRFVPWCWHKPRL